MGWEPINTVAPTSASTKQRDREGRDGRVSFENIPCGGSRGPRSLSWNAGESSSIIASEVFQFFAGELSANATSRTGTKGRTKVTGGSVLTTLIDDYSI